MTNSTPAEPKINPLEAARFLRAFAECSREMQQVALEMSAIIADPSSDDDERTAAFDALMEALFPGAAAEILESYRLALRSPEAIREAEQLRAEELAFAEYVKQQMLAKNLSEAQLSAEAGVSTAALTNILQARCRPQRRTIERFAAALNVKPEDLWPIPTDASR